MDYTTQNYMVKLFKMLSNGNRLRIVTLLLKENKPLRVSDIADVLHMEQSTLSSHLTRMRENKVLKAKQHGIHMYYSIGDPNIGKMLKLITPI